MKAKFVADKLNEDAEPKDIQRIKDIISKSGGNDEKVLRLTQTMANSITNSDKATRRGEAADLINRRDISNIFYNRAAELGGKKTEEVKIQSQVVPVKNPEIDPVSLKSRYISIGSGIGVIFLPTTSAIALWDWEITGQLSDGAWENSKPEDHWKFWCNLESRVGQPEVQSTGYPRKTGYNLVGLIEYIGDRMIKYGKFGKAVGKDILNMGSEVRTIVEDLPEKESGLLERFTETSDPITDMDIGGTLKEFKRKMIEKYPHRSADYYWKGLTQKHIDAYYVTKYNERDMRKDLSIIKEAMKNLKRI